MKRLLLLATIAAAPLPALAQSPADIAAGRALAFDRAKGNCLACHTMAGGDVPSSVGPELSGLKSNYPARQDLIAVLVNEAARNPQTAMPPFGRNRILTPAEIERIVDFLYTL